MTSIGHDAVAGFLAGSLSVFLVVYAFQPNRPYPSWMLEPAEKPWMFFLIILVTIWLFRWDYLVGILFLLFVLSLTLDVIVFTRQITDTMEISQSLFTPAINLIPSIKTLQGGDQFDNQKNDPEILKEKDQVSKKWTINIEPDPYSLRRNQIVDKKEPDNQSYIPGKPLFDNTIQPMSYYPIFAPIVA